MKYVLQHLEAIMHPSRYFVDSCSCVCKYAEWGPGTQKTSTFLRCNPPTLCLDLMLSVLLYSESLVDNFVGIAVVGGGGFHEEEKRETALNRANSLSFFVVVTLTCQDGLEKVLFLLAGS